MVREKYVKQEPVKKEFVRITKQERFKRQLQDLWYYHKLGIALVLAGVLALSLIIAKFTPDKKPDMTILLVTEQEWKNDEYILMIREILGIYMGDITGDSFVKMEVKQFVLDPDNPNSAEHDRFQAEVDAKENYFVLADAANTTWLSKKGYLTVVDDQGLFGDHKFNNYAVDWRICRSIENDYYLSQLKNPLYFSTLKYHWADEELDPEQYPDMDLKISSTEAFYTNLIRSNVMSENYADAIKEYQTECWKDKPALGSPYEK